MSIEEHVICRREGENNSLFDKLWELEKLFYNVLNLISQNTQILIPGSTALNKVHLMSEVPS